ncbi:MAG: hypothetical protein ACNA8L_11340 [Luteolibacter sp.]|jgi:hypothetical protein
MKTKLILLGLTGILLTACDKKSSAPTATIPEVDLGENAFFLTTELPMETIDGTYVPIHLHGVRGAPVHPSHAPSPATRRLVFTSTDLIQ